MGKRRKGQPFIVDASEVMTSTVPRDRAPPALGIVCEDSHGAAAMSHCRKALIFLPLHQPHVPGPPLTVLLSISLVIHPP